jgi:hypothetical protein
VSAAAAQKTAAAAPTRVPAPPPAAARGLTHLYTLLNASRELNTLGITKCISDHSSMSVFCITEREADDRESGRAEQVTTRV